MLTVTVAACTTAGSDEPSSAPPVAHIHDVALAPDGAVLVGAHAGADRRPPLLEPAERGEVRVRDGSVEHVEVFRLGSVRTSILEDLDPYPETDTTTPSSAKSPSSAPPNVDSVRAT